MTDSRFFKNSGPFDVKKLAEVTGAQLRLPKGASRLDAYDNKVRDVAPLGKAEAYEVTFLSNARYRELLATTNAGVCIMHPDLASQAPEDMVLLLTPDSYGAYAKIATAFYPAPALQPGISPNAVIHPSATVGANCQIAPGAVIEENAEIGENSVIGANTVIGTGVIIGKNARIGANVTISYAIIGANAIFHPGVRIGQDGFGFAPINGEHFKIPQLGRVIVGDNVEIGANTCVDRGAGPDTVIGDGCKIDNLVQIGHNVRMGKGCILVSMSGIAGSTKLGDYVIVGGKVGIAGHLSIGTGAQLAAGSGVIQDVFPNEVQGGYPAVPIRQWHRQNIALKKMVKKQGNE